jgi:alkylated DNA repair protein (DNA oxidative demethylase)
MMDDLFAGLDGGLERRENLADGVLLLRGFALNHAAAMCAAIEDIARASPFRHLETPGGYRMSVAMTNCGPLGWSADRRGYRYVSLDPLNERPWPAMPDQFFDFAQRAATEAGFHGFSPDACLINRYAPGAKLSLHQDKDELDLSAPIVSVSLGLPATFLLGGLKRTDPTVRVIVTHGDVLVWGGPSRLRYHAVLPVKDGAHPATGGCRMNLTFRQAKNGQRSRASAR